MREVRRFEYPRAIKFYRERRRRECQLKECRRGFLFRILDLGEFELKRRKRGRRNGECRLNRRMNLRLMLLRLMKMLDRRCSSVRFFYQNRDRDRHLQLVRVRGQERCRRGSGSRGWGRSRLLLGRCWRGGGRGTRGDRVGGRGGGGGGKTLLE